MTDGLRIVAGDCTVRTSGAREGAHRGRVVVVHKPDDTVLVHDATGYQPVAWLTRAETVWTDEEGGGLTAIDGDQRLRVEPHDTTAADHDVSAAGQPVGECPDCGGALVRTAGAVDCLGCGESHGIPRDATVLDEACGCGRPRLRVERGRAFEVCLDRECESLDERVRAAFDREWGCPNCDAALRILRRGGLIAGCERYPECDTGFGLPAGEVVSECPCGLPVFDTGTGRRCLDPGCERAPGERGDAAAGGEVAE
jgi:DNA topoisomerase-1